MRGCTIAMQMDEAREIDLPPEATAMARTRRSAPDAEAAPHCEACRANPSRWRRCTQQQLCDGCRALPEHKIVTFARARQATGLENEDLLPYRQGFVPNPFNVKFKRLPVLYWKDLAALCIARGLEIPD